MPSIGGTLGGTAVRAGMCDVCRRPCLPGTTCLDLPAWPCPACLPAYLPACLPACLHVYACRLLPACLACEVCGGANFPACLAFYSDTDRQAGRKNIERRREFA